MTKNPALPGLGSIYVDERRSSTVESDDAVSEDASYARLVKIVLRVCS